MDIINLSTYRFVTLTDLPTLKQQMFERCEALNLKGTILLSEEGINMNLAGSEAEISSFTSYLESDPRFAGMHLKYSRSDRRPFENLKVKLKKEIITIRQDNVEPEKGTVEHLSPEDFKQWLDENRDINVIDTRNHFEIEFGTFDKALDLNIDRFTQFPDAVDKLSKEEKQKPTVIFCTGGVRCEKAGIVMEHLGFKNVYQLDGGILHYFERCGGAHYHGDCFVFDERVALNPELNEV